MEIVCDLPAAGCSSTSDGCQHMESKEINDYSTKVDDSDNKVVPKVFNEYPVFTYKPFTFHPITSLIHEDIKAMDYVKTVGRCCSGTSDDLYLEDISPQASARINLGFHCAGAVPRIGENVEVFGCVQYDTSKEGDVSKTPLFQVWFFRACRGNIAGYIRTLLQVQQVLGGA